MENKTHPDSTDKNRLEWGQIIVTSFITALLSLLAGIGIWYFTQQKPDLVYEVFPTSSFSTAQTRLSFVNVTIANTGSEPASKVVCHFDFPELSKIMEQNTQPSSKAATYSWDERINNERIFRAPSLINGEEYRFSFLIDALPDDKSVEVSLRAEGIIGRQKKLTESEPNQLIYMFGIIGVAFGFLFGAIMAIQRISLLKIQAEIEKAQKKLARRVLEEWDEAQAKSASRVSKGKDTDA